MRYPFTLDGQDAMLRDEAFALALLFTSVAWLRADRRRSRAQLFFGVLGALLIIEAIGYGGGPGGPLGGAWWNEIVTGVLIVLTVALGRVRVGTDGDTTG